MDSEKILQGSIKSASYNMILQVSIGMEICENDSLLININNFQVAFRVITFVLNGLVLHNVDKDVLGILNVRLMLLMY
jgi:hypothetical protein